MCDIVLMCNYDEDGYVVYDEMCDVVSVCDYVMLRLMLYYVVDLMLCMLMLM